jgi:multiple sugar transport system permease protein
MAVNDSATWPATSRWSRLFRRGSRSAVSGRPPHARGDRQKSFLVTLIAVVVLAAFLSPMLRSVSYALKSTDQITQDGSPLYPADPVTFSYQGKDLPILLVPIDGVTRQLALLEAGRKKSTFIDPASPAAGPIAWVGSWRTLDHVWTPAPHFENFAKVWDLIDYPRLLFNTAAIAIISTICTLLSCTLVAYGFARFRFPGRNLLFTILIATIFLPDAVTIIPTYTIFVKLGWVGTWLPLLVPTFFANAFDVFLMRQYFMTIPTDLDEAASIDGAGPFRTLWSVLIPQSYPVIVAVAVFHLVYAWNDFFGPLLYTSGDPDIQTLALGLQRFNSIHYRDPGLIQAGTLMTMVIPVIAFLLTQRFFTRGLVVTGIDK